MGLQVAAALAQSAADRERERALNHEIVIQETALLSRDAPTRGPSLLLKLRNWLVEAAIRLAARYYGPRRTMHAAALRRGRLARNGPNETSLGARPRERRLTPPSL